MWALRIWSEVHTCRASTRMAQLSPVPVPVFYLCNTHCDLQTSCLRTTQLCLKTSNLSVLSKFTGFFFFFWRGSTFLTVLGHMSGEPLVTQMKVEVPYLITFIQHCPAAPNQCVGVGVGGSKHTWHACIAMKEEVCADVGLWGSKPEQSAHCGTKGLTHSRKINLSSLVAVNNTKRSSLVINPLKIMQVLSAGAVEHSNIALPLGIHSAQHLWKLHIFCISTLPVLTLSSFWRVPVGPSSFGLHIT